MVNDVGVVKYDITDAAIAEMGEKYMGLTVKDPTDEAGFKAVHNARVIVKSKRVEVEKMRVGLKADALSYGRLVDTEAKRITALLAPIESHLIGQERIVTDEKKRKEQEAQEAERLRLETIEREKREAEQKKLQEEQARLDIERERLATIAAEQKAEADRLAAKEAGLAAEQDERQRAAQAKADQDRAIQEALARKETAAREAEAESKRAESLRPDAEKIHAFGIALLAVPTPTLIAPEASKFLLDITGKVAIIATKCRNFNTKEETDA